MPKQQTKSVQLSEGVHANLKAVSEQRKKDGRPDYQMSSMISTFALALYKKEIKS